MWGRWSVCMQGKCLKVCELVCFWIRACVYLCVLVHTLFCVCVRIVSRWGAGWAAQGRVGHGAGEL
jgi:hypothetical protein